MNDEPEALAKAISIKVRVDGSAVAIVKSNRVGNRTAYLPSAELPLTEQSFVELEFFDGADRLIVPAIVTAVGEHQLTVQYEQVGEIFEHWLITQRRRSAG